MSDEFRLTSLFIITDYWCAIGRWTSQGMIPLKKFKSIDLYITAATLLRKGRRWEEGPSA